ncbi:MAG: hypothetical protein ACE5LH_01100 [Fidelibacterota bacterium]
MKIIPPIISALLVSVSSVTAQPADSLLKATFSLKQRLYHHPPIPFFKGRPYNLEVVVDIPGDSLETVSIFLKTDRMSSYQEIPLTPYRGRYLFRYDPEEYPGDVVSYFLVAAARGFRLYAIPLDKSGKIAPFTIHPLKPVKYYEPPE